MPGTSPELTLRGRTGELRTLCAAVDRAVAGSPSITLVDGEAGIGKTRLLAEVLRVADARSCQTASGKAEEMERARPFGLIANALGCVKSASDPRRAAIADLLSGRRASGVEAVTVSSDPGLRYRAVDSLCDLVEELAMEGPLVIGLDDLQWADPSSLLTLGTLARATAGLPVAIIGCHRPRTDQADWRAMVSALDVAGAQHLRLGELDEADVHDLVAEAIEAAPGPGLLAQVAGGGGNPLYVTELVNAIMQEDTLHTANGTAEVTGVTLPSSLRLTILRRLSPLPEEALGVLRTGSLLGSSFSIGELAAVSDRPVNELVPDLEAAITAGALTEDGMRLRFRHDVIRDAVYADIPGSLRLALHRDAARRLADLGAPAAVVAEQFTHGAHRGDREAAEWLVRSAHDAVSTAPGTAADLLQRAYELTLPTDPGRDTLAVERADALMLAGQVGDAAAVCRSLLAGDHQRDSEVPCRVRLGSALLVNGWPEEAVRELDEVEHSPASTDGERARSLGAAGTARLWLGDFDEAERTAEQARAAAVRLGEHRTATEALATQSVVACMRGELARAFELSDEALRLADGSPERSGHGYPVHATRGWLLMELDDVEQARRALESGRRICEELGVRWPLATYQAYLAVARFTAGEWDDAVAELEAGIGFAEETGVTFALKPSHSAQALIRLHRGDLPGARCAADRATAIADRGSRLFDYRAVWVRALLLEAEGDITKAFTTLADRWRTCQDAGMAIDYPVVGPDLVRLARAVGEVALAEEVAAAVRDVASRNEVPSMTGAALRCRGLLADDVEAMRQALDAYADSPRRLELALTCEEAADITARRGDTESARSMLERAGGVFEDLNATRGLLRVDAALRALGVRRGRRGARRRSRWGWGSLTPTEHTVAGLVAEGLSNPQIADRLYVSRRTVQTHVSHIFTKLAITSRAQLAAQVAQQGHHPQHGESTATR